VDIKSLTDSPPDPAPISKPDLFELSLAEFPLVPLNQKVEDLDSIEYTDTIIVDGKQIPRTWKVIPAKTHGFGGSTALDTLYELFQIWKEDDFQDRKINFGSIYKLLKRKQLKSVNLRTYNRIIRDLKALASLQLDIKNAYWDNEKKMYVDVIGLKLFKYAALYKDYPEAQPNLFDSYMVVDDLLWNAATKKSSFFPLSIDSTFFHKLKPLEQRLAIYLEKMLQWQKVHQREVEKLCEQLPITAKSYRDRKKILRRALNGLMDKGYERLRKYEFKKSADGKTDIIVFKSHKRKAVKPSISDSDFELTVRATVNEILTYLQDHHSRHFYNRTVRRVIEHYGDVQLIYRVLAETREACQDATIKKSKAAFFTFTLRRYTSEDGLEI